MYSKCKRGSVAPRCGTISTFLSWVRNLRGDQELTLHQVQYTFHYFSLCHVTTLLPLVWVPWKKIDYLYSFVDEAHAAHTWVTDNVMRMPIGFNPFPSQISRRFHFWMIIADHKTNSVLFIYFACAGNSKVKNLQPSIRIVRKINSSPSIQRKTNRLWMNDGEKLIFKFGGDIRNIIL
jgi:hypothetical protein